MAFFEFLSQLGELLNSATGKFIKPVGGRGLGSFLPSPAQNPPSVGVQLSNTLQQDGLGNLQVRGQMTSDEGAFWDDFPGSALTTSLTGTPTFTNGSIVVTGSGTAFTTELNTDYYIKRDSDGDTAWAKVARIYSDTSLELDTAYTGTTGGSASSKSFWVRSIGSGASISVTGSNITLATGTTNGATTYITRVGDAMPLQMRVRASVSQRIANQSIYVGFRDNVASPEAICGVTFDGTTNTTIKFTSQSSSAASDQTQVTVTLPFGLTTASEFAFEIDLGPSAATLSIEGLIVASVTEHLPGPYTNMLPVLEVKNTGIPASSTNLVADFAGTNSYDLSQVTNISASETVPVQVREEVHYVAGVLTTTATTADQVIVSYTVPTGKVAYIVGFMVSTDGNVDGLPVKIGKNTVTTEPAAPGTTDGNIFRMFRMERPTAAAEIVSQDFSAMPRPLGRAADVLKITVTPSGTGSTKWRASLDIVLRTV